MSSQVEETATCLSQKESDLYVIEELASNLKIEIKGILTQGIPLKKKFHPSNWLKAGGEEKPPQVKGLEMEWQGYESRLARLNKKLNRGLSFTGPQAERSKNWNFILSAIQKDEMVEPKINDVLITSPLNRTSRKIEKHFSSSHGESYFEPYGLRASINITKMLNQLLYLQ